MSDTLPDFYDDLDASFDHGWSLIERGAIDRDSAAHTPAVATIDADGAPANRIMVLRAVSRDARSLRFHTDARADKVAGVEIDDHTSVLIYDADAKIQMRLGGTARIEVDGPVADRAWAAADNYARRCYLAEPGPGTPMAAPTSGLAKAFEGEKPGDDALVSARPHFAVMLVEIETIDFLYLAHQGHRRARFAWQSERWAGQWLVP